MEIVKAIARVIFIITAILFLVSVFLFGCLLMYNFEYYTIEWYSGLIIASSMVMISSGIVYTIIE